MGKTTDKSDQDYKQPQARTIRIFISSTFKDMYSERDYLVKFVFPELKERCIKKGLALVDVDLRWGVTEEEAEQGKAIEICLDEIENCRPFFIGILGERYGYTPNAYQVPDYPQYDWLKKFEKGHSITALEIYHGVLNKKEKRRSIFSYFQKKKGMLPRAFFYFRNLGFIKDVPEAKQHEVKAESEISEKKLFRLKKDIKDTFKVYNIPGHIMETYPCNFKGLKLNWQLLKDSLGSELTEEDRNVLEKVAGDDSLIESREYATLNEKQKDIVNKRSYVFLDGLEQFGNEVRENVWKAICDEHPEENIVTDPLLIEQAYHQRFMNSRTHGFIGREDILGEMANYLNDASSHKPLVLMGEPGSGKSALIAVAAQESETKNKNGYTLVRFVGASPASLDVNKLVQSIIRETASHFKIAVDEQRIDDVKVLYEYFREVLRTTSAKGKLNIFIDAVNQFLPQYDPYYLLWLPKHLPDHVKIIISSIENEYTKNAVKDDLPFVYVGELKPENCKKIVHDTLKEYRKKLNEKQIEMLLSKADAVKPLYLKVACEELRVFPSFELITLRIAKLPDTIAELFMQFLVRLETDHDAKLVKDTLCLIESSMYGLLESELLELLKPADKERLPVNIWARLYRNLSPYLMNAGDEREGLLEFFHLQLSIAVKTRYLKSEESGRSYCKQLADYGLLNYNLKNGNIINTVLCTGIYLYKSHEESALYNLLNDLFDSDDKIYGINKGIAENLCDWVVNNFDFEHEIILRTLIEKLVEFEFPHQFYNFLIYQGDLLRITGNTRWALVFFEKSVEYWNRAIDLDPNNIDFRYAKSKSFLDIGELYQNMGASQQAMELFIKSLETRELIVFLKPNDIDFKIILSQSLQKVAGIYRVMGTNQQALELFKKLKNILEEILTLEPTRINVRQILSTCFGEIGQIYQQMGEGQLALEFFEKDNLIMQKIVDLEPSRLDFKRELASSHSFIGQIYQARTEGQKAIEFFEKSLKVMEELVAIEPARTDFRRDLATSQSYIGQIYRVMEEGLKAIEFFEKQKNTMEELVILEPDRTDFRSGLSVGFSNIGQIYQEIGEKKKALEFFKKGLKIMGELVDIENDRTDFRLDYAIGHWNISWVCSEEEVYHWLNKIKNILGPMISKGVVNKQLTYLWEVTNEYIDKLNPLQLRGFALNYFKKGDYTNAEELLKRIVAVKFEQPGTHCHLARIYILTDRLLEAEEHVKQAWQHRSEAPIYVTARILWFRITLVLLDGNSIENYLGQLKKVFQNKDAIMEWTMKPVLDHLKPKLKGNGHALLTSLVDAMSFKENMDKLDVFKEWKEAQALEVK